MHLALGLLILGGLFDFGPKLERAFSQMAYAEMTQEYGLVEHPLLTPFIQAAGARIAEQAERKAIQYRYLILKTPMENAFATGNGDQYITLGLLMLADNSDEATLVLAHETAHNADKHVIQGLKEQLGISLLFFSLADRLSEEEQILFGVLATLRTLHYSRKDEYRADQLAVRYAVRAGYNPYYYESLFRKLEVLYPTGRLSRLDIAFSSHPRTTDRIARVRQEAEKEIGARQEAFVSALADRGFFREAETFRAGLPDLEQSPDRKAPPASSSGPDYIKALLQTEARLTAAHRAHTQALYRLYEDADYYLQAGAPLGALRDYSQALAAVEIRNSLDRQAVYFLRKTRQAVQDLEVLPSFAPEELQQAVRCVEARARAYLQLPAPADEEVVRALRAWQGQSLREATWRALQSAREERRAREDQLNELLVCALQVLTIRGEDLIRHAEITDADLLKAYFHQAGLGEAWTRSLRADPEAPLRALLAATAEASPKATWTFLNLLVGDLRRLLMGPRYDQHRMLYVILEGGP